MDMNAPDNPAEVAPWRTGVLRQLKRVEHQTALFAEEAKQQHERMLVRAQGILLGLSANQDKPNNTRASRDVKRCTSLLETAIRRHACDATSSTLNGRLEQLTTPNHAE